MAYYIISFDSDAIKDFQKRIPFLEGAVLIKDKKQLEKEISSPGGDAFFFMPFLNKRASVDEFALILREKLPQAKILYVTFEESAPDLKAHQLTPAGGDVYIPSNIDPGQLQSILGGLTSPSVETLNQSGNRLDSNFGASVSIGAEKSLEDFKNHPSSQHLDKIFLSALGKENKKPLWQSSAMLIATPSAEEYEVPEVPAPVEAEVALDEQNDEDVVFDEIEENAETKNENENEDVEEESGDDMSDKDQELSLDDLGDLELGDDAEVLAAPADEGGLDFDLDAGSDLDLSSGDDQIVAPPEDDGMDFDLGDGLSLDDNSSADTPSLEEDGGLDFIVDEGDDAPALDLGSDDELGSDLELSDELSLDENDDAPAVDLSDDALEKLKEIDAIMDYDASQVGISLNLDDQNNDDDDLGGLSLDLGGEEASSDSDIDTSLVGDDLDLGSISFSNDEEIAPVVEEKTKKKTAPAKEVKEVREAYDGNIGKDLKEISGAYSGEMERMQATLSNLRSDREELLARIQKLEDDKLLQNRQSLTMRAELDEKKIELSIIRKKLNEEITELKDRQKLQDEKRLILEEKNRILTAELDKAGQKNKIDVRKVQMRERELEQKLELLKADSETQIRHRDLKILELKRKLDAMEFDVESISVQEKRSVESRFELEDKLDKAIKTLRNAITVLEDESDKSGVLEALKKNIDM